MPPMHIGFKIGLMTTASRCIWGSHATLTPCMIRQSYSMTRCLQLLTAAEMILRPPHASYGSNPEVSTPRVATPDPACCMIPMHHSAERYTPGSQYPVITRKPAYGARHGVPWTFYVMHEPARSNKESLPQVQQQEFSPGPSFDLITHRTNRSSHASYGGERDRPALRIRTRCLTPVITGHYEFPIQYTQEINLDIWISPSVR